MGNVPLEQQSSERIMTSGTEADEVLEQRAKALTALHRWDPPHYELGVFGGYMRYPYRRNEAIVFLVVPDDNSDPTFAAVLADQFDPGWTVGITVTLNSWKWFSNQFSYVYTRGKYEIGAAFSEPTNQVITGTTGLVTRQFEYNLLWNFRPPKSRWRPYAAVGPALLLTSLSDSPITKAAGPFKLGLQNVGLLLAAYNFGRKAPLDGGGVFSPGIVYGGGVKYRVHPRITLSLDFRETLSKSPNFLSDSYTKEYFADVDYNLQTFRFTTDQKYREQRFTAGVAFTF